MEPLERMARFSIQVGVGNWWISVVGSEGVRVLDGISLGWGVWLRVWEGMSLRDMDYEGEDTSFEVKLEI